MIDLTLQLDLSLRLVLAAALGALIGGEREIHGHPAGIRTHMLVALGSGLFTVLSIHGFGQGPGVPIDPTRIAAQIVSGIGFLGAGAILKDGIVIRGLTTAASLWATAAVGMAAGAGEYIVGAVGAGVVLVSLWPINVLAQRLHGSDAPEVQLRLHLDRVDLVGRVSSILLEKKLEIGSISTQRLSKNSYQADLMVRARRSSALTSALEALSGVEGIDVVSTSQSD
ncbi:MAG TPA: MgtC/SapB family protein [Candidatus Limnocylindrales bacterium]|nr:MgtC/SapB family protein [Candidatus Limnocylindrales bacterium]